MYGRIVKSERILTKLRVLDYEYICDRTAKFHKKIFITRVINIQILTTKYFSFQYSVTYCSQALWRQDSDPAHKARGCPPISPNPISPNPISPNGLGLEG